MPESLLKVSKKTFCYVVKENSHYLYLGTVLFFLNILSCDTY